MSGNGVSRDHWTARITNVAGGVDEEDAVDGAGAFQVRLGVVWTDFVGQNSPTPLKVVQPANQTHPLFLQPPGSKRVSSQSCCHDTPRQQHLQSHTSGACVGVPGSCLVIQLLGTSQPGWEDLGWVSAAYWPSYQVILFDWMVCLNNVCNHCKLQLGEVTLARGYHEEYVQPCSSCAGNVTRGSKISLKWSEVGDREADGQKTE